MEKLPGLFTDRTDGRAAFTDNITDFVGVDFHRDHGQTFSDNGTGRPSIWFILTEDVQARFRAWPRAISTRSLR